MRGVELRDTVDGRFGRLRRVGGCIIWLTCTFIYYMMGM